MKVLSKKRLKVKNPKRLKIKTTKKFRVNTKSRLKDLIKTRFMSSSLLKMKSKNFKPRLTKLNSLPLSKKTLVLNLSDIVKLM